MENSIILIIVGLLIGTIGTLIGAGGGFILVPLLLIFYPEFSPEVITAISMAVVSVNAISGTFAYARSGRVDYKAGITFAVFTIPGSVLGVYTVQYIPQKLFNIIFGILLILLSAYLFYKNKNTVATVTKPVIRKGYKQRLITDKKGILYAYSYNSKLGNIISIIVGYISPLLGIGGGIIHVPAMVNILKFPVHIATATSHFILAVMTTVSVLIHAFNGTYDNPATVKMILLIALGVVPGAQVGALLSHKVKSSLIIKSLAVCLIIVGIRILLKSL
ncbi:sulfite exporter TauE/SafE family protein [Flavobacterium salilacus subsp. salilacus]|uniref:sulfite exporter TauE/SafE family protein n=1 Tax=Flavobacterium TaxID=237 RepID=UPI0010756B54|nr:MULTISPECIES: sulfite exporter TauE/SafE family protein [Flavobacterium]KAF2518683.1 sulfite exporter TauE/SafE family protein [Flavobacterium salilacus subsp. salilacus]MBE1613646.1 sulfite exporter TauE/SafE family protein [Flavobacterium sp. SaA2.13]